MNYALRLGIALALALALALAGGIQFAQAQAYPAKPIRFIVPFPPGGGTDLTSRAVTQRLSQSTGWVFVLDNKPGAGGNIGAEAAARSAPDGYTLVLGQASNLAINPYLYSKPPFDPVKDFAPVALINAIPLVILAGAKSPYKTLADVISAARAVPDRVTFASPGSGTVGHLAAVLLARNAGVKLTHVPYKGAAPALTDLIGGQVDLYFSTAQAAIGQIKSGSVRAIAVTSAKRLPELPQVPTVAEAGQAGAEASSWYGVLAPAGTPDAIVQRLNLEITRVLQTPEMRETLSRDGGEVLGGTPAQFAAFLAAEQARWSRVVRESGAKVD